MRAWLATLAVSGALLSACKRDADPASASAVVVHHPTGPVPGPHPRSVPQSNPLAGEAAAEQAGRRLFVRYNCSGCHGGRAGGGMGPSLRDRAWIYGSTAADIFTSISEGRAHGMPTWGSRIPAQQIWELVTYVQSLGTMHEPDRPQ